MIRRKNADKSSGMENSATQAAGAGILHRFLPTYAGTPRLLGYVALVVVTGVAMLFLEGRAGLTGLVSFPFLIWLLICIGAEFLWLETLTGDCTDSMASTVNFAVLFLLGQTLALWVIAMSVFIATRFIQRRDWVRSMFGLGQISITAFCSAAVFHALHSGELTLESLRSFQPAAAMLASAAAYFFVNTGLVAGAVALQTRSPFWSTWRVNYGYRNSIVSFVALFALCPMLLISYLTVGYGGVLLFFIPLLIVKNQNREYIKVQKMMQALIGSERMAAKGEMAAEVAHEINNYLAVLSGRIQLLQLRAERAGEDSMRSDAEVIRQQIQKMTTLAKGLLDFSHKGIRVQTFELNNLVTETIEFIRPQNLFDGIEIRHDLDDRVGEVQADPGQLQQVLINLVRNAAEAMREALESNRLQAASLAEAESAHGPCGGRIEVRTMLDKGALVRVEVQDNGPGMPAGILAKVFEPAFTTRPDGHGYGLATCYRILENHGGRIRAESTPGKGTTFRFEFPRRTEVKKVA